MSLPYPIPTASGLDVAAACPGSREVEHVEEPETAAMRNGKEKRHLPLQRWVEAGCPAEWPFDAKYVAPIGKLPRFRPHPRFPAAAEVYFWLDPVQEEAGVICTGRRPESSEYPKGDYLVCGGTDVVGLDEDGYLGVCDWKGRNRTVWQVEHAAAAAWVTAGRPAGMVSLREHFNPSGFLEYRLWDERDVEAFFTRLRLLVKTLLAQRAGYPARFEAGKWCAYCRAYPNCPIKGQAMPFRAKDRR